MADAIIADLASGLVGKLVSLATEEVIQAWNFLDDLVTLRQRLESIDALLSDAETKKLTMSAVQNWFNQLEAVAHVADVLLDELAYEVTRQKVEYHLTVRDFFLPSKNNMLYRFKAAHKIKSINTSFDNIFTTRKNILLTTRSQDVTCAMRCSVSYQVEKLSEEDSYELFKKIAFSRGGVVETETFTALGRRMVKRCGGSPLAIKTLGGLLHSKESEQEWLEIQNSEIWKSKGVLSSLRLSYDNLPYSSLKRCFVYCSIIPKDADINKDELVQIWMALGFLFPARGSDALMEDIGNEYFNILLCNSLLQDVEKDEVGNITSCKMHDLALDLSKHHSVTVKTGHEMSIISDISQPIYVRLDEGLSDSKPTILKRNFERVQALYTGARILGDVLPYLKHLTVLVLNADELTHELPSSLSRMKYLKYLDVSCFYGELPSYITDLYNLQTLRVSDIQVLPKKFCNLINLRHLYIVRSCGRYGRSK